MIKTSQLWGRQVDHRSICYPAVLPEEYMHPYTYSLNVAFTDLKSVVDSISRVWWKLFHSFIDQGLLCIIWMVQKNTVM